MRFGANQLHGPLQLCHNTYNEVLGLNKAVKVREADNVVLLYLEGQGTLSVLKDQLVNAEVCTCEDSDAA